MNKLDSSWRSSCTFYLNPSSDNVSDGHSNDDNKSEHSIYSNSCSANIVPPNPSLLHCSWAQMHTDSEVLACYNTGRIRNSFTLLGIKTDSKKTSYRIIEELKVNNPLRCASIYLEYAALGIADNSIEIHIIQEPKTKKWIPEFQKKCVINAENFISKTFSINSFSLEQEDLVIPKKILTLDLIKEKLLFSLKTTQYICDINNPNVPQLTYNCNVPSFVSQWNPLAPEIQFVSGMFNGKLKFYDTRVSHPVQDVKHAHDGIIRTVKFNPIIGEWVASGGEDGKINIWDLRNLATPVRTLIDHIGPVNCLSWSPTNVDFLASGGSDRNFKLWNIRSHPHYIITNFLPVESSVVSVGWMNARGIIQAFAVTTNGSIYTAAPSDDVLDKMTPSWLLPQKRSIKSIETTFYRREFGSGFRKVYDLAKKLLKLNKIDEASSLLDLCYQRPPLKAINLSKPIPFRDKSEFEEQLNFYSYFIPPNYADHLWPVYEHESLLKLQHLKTSLDLERAVTNENAKEIFQILLNSDYLKQTLIISTSKLYRIFSVTLAYDYCSSLQFASLICPTYEKNISNFYGIANLILYPTIFETLQDSETLYKDLIFNEKNEGFKNYTSQKLSQGIRDAINSLKIEANCTYLISQFDLLRNFFKKLWSSQPKSVLSVFDGNPICLSATAWKIYFNAAIAEKQFEKLYVWGSVLAEKVRNFPFFHVLINIMNENVSKIQRYWRDCTSINLGILQDLYYESESLTNLNRLGYASNTIIVIMQNSNFQYLPKSLVNVLDLSLTQFMSDIKATARDIPKDPSASEITSKILIEASNKINEILGKKINPINENYINEYVSLINSLISGKS